MSSSSWKENLLNLINHDNNKQTGYYFKPPDILTSLLSVKERDFPLFYCLYNCGIFAVGNVILILLMHNYSWYYFAPFTFIRYMAISMPIFYTAQHYSVHHGCIQPEWLNTFYSEYFLAPFYGLAPGVYNLHHLIMHHKQENIWPHDLSSTMPYQRDNWCHWITYWLRFEFLNWFEMPYLLYKNKLYFYCIRTLVMFFIVYPLLIYLFWCIRPALCIWTWIIPNILTSIILMIGNWSQHIFVDIDNINTLNKHQMTINLIHTEYNQNAFNDGYHIIHHKYVYLHWTQFPKRFMDEKEIFIHGNNDAICFKDIDYAKHYFVPISQKQSNMTVKEIVEFFQQRLKPCKLL